MICVIDVMTGLFAVEGRNPCFKAVGPLARDYPGGRYLL